MKCKSVQERLVEYKEEALEQRLRGQITTHLQTCPACRQEFREIEHTLQLLQTLPAQEPPAEFWPDFTAQVMRKVRQAEPPQAVERLWWWMPNFRIAMAAAAIIVFVLGGFLAYSRLRQTPETIALNAPALMETPQPSPESAQTTLDQSFAAIVNKDLSDEMLKDSMGLLAGDFYALDESYELPYALINSLTEEEQALFLSELEKMQ